MACELRTNHWSSMRVTAPSGGYTVGQLAKVEDTVGFIVEAIDANDVGALIYRAEKVVVPKSTTSGQNVLAAGDKVYFDVAEGKVCAAESGNVLCGRALEAAGAAATTVLIDLDGTLA